MPMGAGLSALSTAQAASPPAAPAAGVPVTSLERRFARSLAQWIDAAPAAEKAARKTAADRIDAVRRSQGPGLSLKRLDLSSLPDCLAELPQLLDLDLGRNRLTRLPALPPGLLFLTLSKNQLGNLPVLPANLLRLKANSNRFTQLPDLPASLSWLDVCKNRLQVLPPLPAEMRFLAAGENLLTALPALPPRLEQLWIEQNRIDRLPDSLPALTFLSADHEAIDNLLQPLRTQVARLESALAAPAATGAAPAHRTAYTLASGQFAVLPDHLIQTIAEHFTPGSGDAVRLAATHRSLAPALAEQTLADRQVAIPPQIELLRNRIERIETAYTQARMAAIVYPEPGIMYMG